MPRNRPSFYIESTESQVEALIKGLQWLVAEAKKSTGAGLVAVALKSNLENFANFRPLAPIFQPLRQYGKVKVEGVSLHLFTPKCKELYAWNGPVLVIYGGQELLDAVDSLTRATSVLCIPRDGNEYKNWVATWGALNLDQGTEQVAENREPLSSVAWVALKDLTDTVNVSRGILHEMDYEYAVKTLETLFHKHADCGPETIRQQLIRFGWAPTDAAKVKELAEKIWNNRRPKGSTGKADEALWKYWNESRD